MVRLRLNIAEAAMVAPAAVRAAAFRGSYVIMNRIPPNKSSRRPVLKAIASLAVAATLPALTRQAAAQAKASKAALQYQGRPKNGLRCSTCVQFVPPGQCKIVEGSIDPDGWCMAYIAKG